MSGYFVKVLSAMVKVHRRAEDGTPRMRTGGYHPATGEPLLVPDIRNVTLQKGDELPEDVADGEVERLLTLDPPAIGRKAAVSVMSAPSSTAKSSSKSRSKSKSSSKRKSVSKRAAAKSKTASAGKPPAEKPADLSMLGTLNGAELVKAISTVGASALIDAVGSDSALAQRLLDAEKTASSGDPRTDLLDGLQKVIDGGAS